MTTHRLLNPGLVLPLAVLVFASGTSCALLGARMLLLGSHHQMYLVWNLFLAWLPLAFALAVCWLGERGRPRRWPFLAAATGWFFFFPNAPYILTDLIHLGSKAQRFYWPDLVLILLFALTGLSLGFVSLFLMQRIVTHRFGWVGGWLFAASMAALSGFGIYAGRFLRWNSWDVFLSPVTLIDEGIRWVTTMPSEPRSLILPVLFGTLLFVSYITLYGLTHLQPGYGVEPALQTAPEA